MKLPGRDLVAERLADLRDAERRLAAGELGDVLEVDEDALRRLRAGGNIRSPVSSTAPTRVSNMRLNWRASVRSQSLGLARALARPLAALRVVEMVGAEAQLADAAVDERIGEAADVTRRLPDLRVQDDRRVERDDVVALAAPSPRASAPSRSPSAARRSGRSRTTSRARRRSRTRERRSRAACRARRSCPS